MYRYLLPFSLIYGLIVTLRNTLFNWQWLKSKTFNIPVISVGNITVGGTGKTPHIEHLISLLGKKYRLAIISRGYKRKTKGYLEVTLKSNAADVGDEPLQIKQKFSHCTVAVDEKRAHAIDYLLTKEIKPELVLLDDAYQHRHVKPSLNILLVDYNRPITKDLLLPAGRLREPAKNSNRADLVLVTKCPVNLNPMQVRIMTKELNLFPYQKLLFTTYAYKQLRPVFPTHPANKNIETADASILAVAGIANPTPFFSKLQSYKAQVTQLTFADHHDFTTSDIDKIKNAFTQLPKKDKLIVCTEKDAIRLKTGEFRKELSKLPIYYLPIEVEFLYNGEKEFNQLIQNHIDSFNAEPESGKN